MPMNAAFGWVWTVCGVLSGLALGLGFQRDGFLGGYGSFRRRLLRLGHIAFFGLGFLNILFALSASRLDLSPWSRSVAGMAFIAGGLTMPACCALLAWRRGFYLLFGVPVTAVLLGTALTAAGMLRA